MASVIPGLAQLYLGKEENESSDIDNEMRSLLISDNVFTLDTTEHVFEQNTQLKNKITHLEKYYKEYILTLHKMIALLKKQNTDICRTAAICSDVKSLSLGNIAHDHLTEQQFLCDQISSKQQELESKQIVFNDVKQELESCQEHIQNLNKLQDEHRERDTTQQLDEYRIQYENLRLQNQSLLTENNQIKQLLLQKDEKIRILSDTVYATPQQQVASPTNARPWIVHHSEISVSNQLLGTGAWGTVSLGTFRGLTVAVKQLHRLILSQYNQNKFLREMEISSTIRHPHILQFICCSQQDQTLYVVTEVMERSVREAYLSNHISKPHSVRVLLQCALALQYLHEFKPDPIIHRDISSCNVLISHRSCGWIGKLSDFGAANFLRDNLSSNPGAAIYAALEAFSSAQNTKLDVFSFGVLMIELFTHSLPDPNSRDYQLSRIENFEIRQLVGRMLVRAHDERPDMSVVVASLRFVLNLPSGALEDCVFS